MALLSILLLIFALWFQWTIIKTSPQIISALKKKKDTLSARTAKIVKGIAIIQLILLVVSLSNQLSNFNSSMLQDLIFASIGTLFAPVALAFIPNIYIKLRLVASGAHSSRAVWIVIAQTLIALGIIFWFTQNFNHGRETFRMIQITLGLIAFDAVYETLFFVSTNPKKLAGLGVLIGSLYIGSIFFIPLETYLTFDWNTVQSIPFELVMYYIVTKSLYNLISFGAFQKLGWK